MSHDRWYRIEIVNYSTDAHQQLNQTLRAAGYSVLANWDAGVTWTTSSDPRDEIMLPLKMNGCSVTRYEDMMDALQSKCNREFDNLDSA